MRILIRGGSSKESCESLCKKLKFEESGRGLKELIDNFAGNLATDLKYFRCYNYKFYFPGNTEDVLKLKNEDVICSERMPNRPTFS